MLILVTELTDGSDMTELMMEFEKNGPDKTELNLAMTRPGLGLASLSNPPDSPDNLKSLSNPPDSPHLGLCENLSTRVLDHLARQR